MSLLIPPRLSRLPLLPLAVGLALLLGGFVLWPRQGPQPPAGAVPAVWATDVAGHPPGAVRLGAQVPSKPFEGQKTPPCERGLERQVEGGCWVATEHKEPCPAGTYTHGGLCLLPVKRAERPPTSLGE